MDSVPKGADKLTSPRITSSGPENSVCTMHVGHRRELPVLCVCVSAISDWNVPESCVCVCYPEHTLFSYVLLFVAARRWHLHWHADSCSGETHKASGSDKFEEAVGSKNFVSELLELTRIGNRPLIQTCLLFFLMRPTWTTQTIRSRQLLLGCRVVLLHDGSATHQEGVPGLLCF